MSTKNPNQLAFQKFDSGQGAPLAGFVKNMPITPHRPARDTRSWPPDPAGSRLPSQHWAPHAASTLSCASQISVPYFYLTNAFPLSALSANRWRAAVELASMPSFRPRDRSFGPLTVVMEPAGEMRVTISRRNRSRRQFDSDQGCEAHRCNTRDGIRDRRERRRLARHRALHQER